MGIFVSEKSGIYITNRKLKDFDGDIIPLFSKYFDYFQNMLIKQLFNLIVNKYNSKIC
jgi:hypothetical protein